MRITISDIAKRKRATPIVVLTAYTAPIARLLDPLVDILLVGDSLGMVLYGMPNTHDVTLDMMIRHGKAVVESSSHALVVVDMPAGSYESSPAQALESAKCIIAETGAGAIKMEGGADRAEIIAHLVKNNIPVMGHIGLMPQRVTSADGFRYQGRTPEDAARIFTDALAVQKAGAFSLVIEAVAETVARDITEKLSVPTIGIGASPACDGQVLVIDDMLGIGGYAPSFVKQYADLSEAITSAVKTYAGEVRTRAFPSPEFCFPKKK